MSPLRARHSAKSPPTDAGCRVQNSRYRPCALAQTPSQSKLTRLSSQLFKNELVSYWYNNCTKWRITYQSLLIQQYEGSDSEEKPSSTTIQTASPNGNPSRRPTDCQFRRATGAHPEEKCGFCPLTLRQDGVSCFPWNILVRPSLHKIDSMKHAKRRFSDLWNSTALINKSRSAQQPALKSIDVLIKKI